MKRMLKYIIASSLILMFSGCNDWLNVQPKSEIRSDIQFETEGGFKDALIGVYLGLTEDALYAKDLTWHFVDILAQQYPLHSLSTNIGIKNYEYTSTTVMPRIENIWLKAYNWNIWRRKRVFWIRSIMLLLKANCWVCGLMFISI